MIIMSPAGLQINFISHSLIPPPLIQERISCAVFTQSYGSEELVEWQVQHYGGKCARDIACKTCPTSVQDLSTTCIMVRLIGK